MAARRIARTILLCTAACLLAGGTAQAASCPSDNPRSVADAVRGVFTAMQAHDDAAVKASFTADFYAFDGGRRFDGSALPKLIADAQAAGKTYVWSVNDPDVHIVCDHAWIAYVNKGSLTDAKGTAPLTWLESAMLRFEGGRWRIEFLHSTRVAPPSVAATAPTPSPRPAQS